MKATMDENTFCLGCALKIISLLNAVDAACYRLPKQKKNLCIIIAELITFSVDARLRETSQLPCKFLQDQIVKRITSKPSHRKSPVSEKRQLSGICLPSECNAPDNKL